MKPSPEELQRRRELAKIRLNGCGCTEDVCKHYYANIRQANLRGRSATEGEHAEEWGAATPPPPNTQAFLDITGCDILITPVTARRAHALLSRRLKRLSTSVSDAGSAQALPKESRTVLTVTRDGAQGALEI